ncbi:MAG: translational machinery protein [Undibacterium sp.]|uniref:translational machinery protein n=1 Tax=Undibacterium sp. TaxID=1914977 RepID=UPI0027268D93|nr:translational machinery protein [Undibacterium sp.]MDO8650613.1 translational machinery protein [Undibacterium sp.]
MSSNHVVVWIDHTEAHVIHFTPEAGENQVILTHSTHPHLHVKSRVQGSGHAAENIPYFDDIAKAIKDSLEILIVGPGLEKLAFMKHLIKHQHLVAEKVVSVETVDHPTDAQLVAYARKYFANIDSRLR